MFQPLSLDAFATVAFRGMPNCCGLVSPQISIRRSISSQLSNQKDVADPSPIFDFRKVATVGLSFSSSNPRALVARLYTPKGFMFQQIVMYPSHP